MSNRMYKILPVLKRIRRFDEKAKREYVRNTDKEFVECVSECAKNIIKGSVPLTHSQKTKLRRTRRSLRVLSIKKTPLKKKRQILQKGGFLSALIPPIVTLISSLLFKNGSS